MLTPSRSHGRRAEFKAHQISHLVTAAHRDVVSDGFGLKDVADAGEKSRVLGVHECRHPRACAYASLNADIASRFGSLGTGKYAQFG